MDETGSHMWIPELDFPEVEIGERCRLCGVLRGVVGRDDPPEAARPCPETWPPPLPTSGGQLSPAGVAARLTPLTCGYSREILPRVRQQQGRGYAVIIQNYDEGACL